MKRAKIILLTFAVLTTVGAALAFKAQKFGSTNYCYVQAEQATTCADVILSKSARAWVSPENKVFYKVVPTGTEPTQSNCQALTCNILGVPDQQ